MGKLWRSSSQCLRFRNSQFVACATILPKTWIAAWTLEGQARKSHSSRLLKWTLDCSSNIFFWNSEAVAEPFDAPRFEASRTSGFEWCLKVLFHRPSQNKSTQDCSVSSQVPTKCMACPCLLSPKNWETQHLPGDSKWPFLIHLLCFDSHTWMSTSVTVSYCHWLLLFKGPKKAYKISILKKVSNPWITRWKEDLGGAFCSHSHSTLRQSHGPTTRCVAMLIHRSANACWCSA